MTRQCKKKKKKKSKCVLHTAACKQYEKALCKSAQSKTGFPAVLQVILSQPLRWWCGLLYWQCNSKHPAFCSCAKCIKAVKSKLSTLLFQSCVCQWADSWKTNTCSSLFEKHHTGSCRQTKPALVLRHRHLRNAKQSKQPELHYSTRNKCWHRNRSHVLLCLWDKEKRKRSGLNYWGKKLSCRIPLLDFYDFICVASPFRGHPKNLQSECNKDSITMRTFAQG